MSPYPLSATFRSACLALMTSGLLKLLHGVQNGPLKGVVFVNACQQEIKHLMSSLRFSVMESSGLQNGFHGNVN